jgi:hypothetical protein
MADGALTCALDAAERRWCRRLCSFLAADEAEVEL